MKMFNKNRAGNRPAKIRAVQAGLRRAAADREDRLLARLHSTPAGLSEAQAEAARERCGATPAVRRPGSRR